MCLLRGTDWVFKYNSGLNKYLRSAHTAVFTCSVWISEQTAIISLYNINYLVFITEMECLLRGTDWVFIYNSDQSQSKPSAPTTQCIGEFRTMSQNKENDYCRTHHSPAGLSSVLCEVKTEILTPLFKGLNSLNSKALPQHTHTHTHTHTHYFMKFIKLDFLAKLSSVFRFTLFTRL